MHLREEVVLLAAYLLSSGRRQVEETPEYAVYRLLEGARRSLELLDCCGGDGPSLASVRARLAALFDGPPAQHDFAALLDDLCQEVVEALQAAAPPVEHAP
ncbi:DUF6092 family protein [Saccharopolyspora sp. WRP15-2]|uniref:DUF6092 family protein n=1 Tax=Saccharopolyspora oryzae TaxID=2997343 RepID=A0ABT4UU61_9PSEU|nr:DUF6092 family protein [Saccharopolyspora oryzae]MDA3625238.1 DUF6092 family protein [Saccharopolyspora oryzae]